MVSCALDEDDACRSAVDGKKYEFPGRWGWRPSGARATDRATAQCQRWVSACVLARVDAAGVKRLISIRGDHPRCARRQGAARYTDREATYYGNVFIRGQPRYLCLSPGKTSNERVCGDSLTDCPMTVVGSCEDACADEGDCSAAFQDCSDRGRARRGTVYHESITVFLPK